MFANAVATIKATTLADVDLKKYEGVSKRVKSAKVTDAGVYVIEVEGAGFGINGDAHYGASGEYILVRVAITKDGTVVDCYTVSQKETNGFGSVCADEEFYGQFAGKTEADYKEVIIAGSTITTKGYQGAILSAFKAVKIFEGGAN